MAHKQIIGHTTRFTIAPDSLRIPDDPRLLFVRTGTSDEKDFRLVIDGVAARGEIELCRSRFRSHRGASVKGESFMFKMWYNHNASPVGGMRVPHCEDYRFSEMRCKGRGKKSGGQSF